MHQFDFDFRRAIDAFNANDIAKAETILTNLRKASRGHFDVEHLLGIIMLIQNRYADALPYLQSALGINGNDDQALSNYGYALKCLNRAEEALEYFKRSLAINPRNSITCHNI